MFQYFPDEDVAVASVDGQVFLLSRSPKSRSFRAVGVSGMDLTQPAVEAGLMQTFLAAADAAADSALTACVLQTMDSDTSSDPDSSGLISARELMDGDLDEDELLEEKDRLDSAGLLGPVETLYGDEFCKEESLLSAAGLTEFEDQGSAVRIDPSIPNTEKLAFVRDIVAVRHSLVEKPWVEEPTYDALFSQVDLAAWWRVFRLLELYPRGMERDWRRHPFCVWPVRQIQVSADAGRSGEDGCMWGREARVLSVSWETLKSAAARFLGPEDFASEEAYARARRAAADVAGRALETTSDLLGKLRTK